MSGKYMSIVCLFFVSVVFESAMGQSGEILINEFLASNDTIAPDNSDFDDYSDWIELYNPGSSSLDLDNYYLSDDLAAPTKWRFPAGTTLAAGQFLVIRADGFNAGPGETYVRGYYPWGSTFTTRRHHASFKLSADGESIGIFRVDTPPTETTVIAKRSTWKYRDLGTDPGAAWADPRYDDSSWAAGPAPLGYNDSWIATNVSYGPQSGSKYATTYFRHRFNVADPTVVSNARLAMMADDSAIVYLNGLEVARLRMPLGPVNFDQYSGQVAPNENVYETIELSSLPLQAGENVLAVEVHQQSGTSSDQSFDIELKIDVITDPAVMVDSVTYGVQRSDISQGRTADGGWASFGIPSPGSANTSAPLVEPFETSPEVIASLDSGFFESAQAVALSGAGPGAIRFTLDGSDPKPDSAAYSVPLVISTSTILRARIYEEGKIPGPTLTRSYFLGDDASPGLPVLSFVADPETLFGDEIGIYENDTAHVFKGREVPVRIEFFEQDKTQAFAVNAGTRIAGENIWQKPQKPFNVYLRGKYGDDSIQYQLFPGEASALISEFNLRNGGDDWEETLLRDAMMPSVLDGQMDASMYTYRPCSLYLNGSFHGIYNIRKRFDASYFANEHHLGADGYDLVQYAHDENGVTRLLADGGTTERYEAFLDFINNNNPADPAVYDQIEEQMNVDSFIDYVVATDFAFNTSWSHNREFWCGRNPGSKWEWIINDFDRGFDIDATNSSSSKSLIDDFIGSYRLFQRLDNNSEFVNRLLQRYAAHCGSTFYPQRFNDRLDALIAEQDGEISRHVARWGPYGGFSESKRLNEIAEIKRYVVERPAVALSRLQTYLGVNRSMTTLDFAASPSSGGSIEIAGVPMLPEYSQSVSLFQSTPVELHAIPAPGFSFVSWSNGSTSPSITLSLSGAASITANFASGAESVLPQTINASMTLTAADSPYVVDDRLIVVAGATLTIESGVTVRLTEGASVLVHGTLLANGTEAEPIRFESRDGKAWGNIGFENTTTLSSLKHVIIRDATLSRENPLHLKAAVSGYHADILLDHVDIDGPQPIFSRFGSTTLLDSRIHITFTGDGINVKNGDAHVERCTLTGNDSVDTDAIDYDGVVDGIIRDNRIYNFLGDNSDGIDVGEECVNLLVEKNRIYNNSDKGISVGQASEVIIRQNLIVGCVLGCGIKDTGSIAWIDQNTFARNDVGVAVYEKNLGSGGGAAVVENCIFSRSKTAPVTVDSLSSLSVTWSMSDTLPITGTGNITAEPVFTSPGIYDFSLQPASPAIDAGDPAHDPDPDSSRADVGMAYLYDPLDYPFLTPNVIVINELLSSSPGIGGDWIELHNNGDVPIDISGWYLSANALDLKKYRIANGTVLAGGGYIVYGENTHFGAGSGDPGSITPFALNGNGETVFVYKPAEGLDLEYLESEDFGAAEPGVTLGRLFKPSTGTYNFVAMKEPTPGASNSLPKIGPIVISEIMYHPAGSSDSEYLELLNISPSPVTLYDASKGAAWAITNGIDFSFPSSPPVVMQPGERLILTRSVSAFAAEFGAPIGTKIFQWSTGGLSNSGETIELGMPGDLDSQLVRQFIRVDRVVYSDTTPWPTSADGAGPALERINPYLYGNDHLNWSSQLASPGRPDSLPNFYQWSSDFELAAGINSPSDDPDRDGLSNLLEYAIGTSPLNKNLKPISSISSDTDGILIEFPIADGRDDLDFSIEMNQNLNADSWIRVHDTTFMETSGGLVLRALVQSDMPHAFYRMVVRQR
ncbi:MAG: lamin tail domain-containing protein [Luteolibacter sp.]